MSPSHSVGAAGKSGGGKWGSSCFCLEGNVCTYLLRFSLKDITFTRVYLFIQGNH